MESLGVGSWIARRRAIAPDSTAVIFGDRSWTYAELDDRITGLAGGLRSAGVGAGDRVAYFGPNHPAFLELLFAATSIGAIAMPVNYRLAPDDLAFVLRDAAPRVLVHSAEPTGVGEELRTIECVVDLERGYEDLVRTVAAGSSEVTVDLDTTALLTYTSGTTGRPKGVPLTHGNLLANAMNWLIAGDFRTGDVALAITPFFRVGGLAVTLLETFLVGGTNVVMDVFEPRHALQLIEQHQVSVLFGGPELLRGLDAHPSFGTTDFSSVRVCYTGGAPVPEPLLRSFMDRGIPILQGYGLSEAGPLVLLLEAADMARKVGSAGRPVFFTESRVVGVDGADVAAGDVGEIVARGPNVTAGYWNNPDATRRAIDDEGWLHTGDAARVDDEGYVSIVGRLADAFSIGGVLVFPGDAERALLDHPAIEDAAVVGRPDPGLGEWGVGFVVRVGDDTTAEPEILAWLRPQLELPDAVRELRFVESIERNPAGKIMRHKLRAALGAE
jgi:acyl-CoA synthetase (AMP-forming)/AMP-acid ligase II